MKMLVVTHADFERPGSIQSWAEKNRIAVDEVKPYRGEVLPSVSEYEFIVVMGGPQSPLSIDDAPYLSDEILLLKDAISQGKRIIGICLGAQLISEALGVKTERSPHREIGSYPLELLADASEDPVFGRLSSRFDVMHWHSDMPGIPNGAKLLAKSEGCPRQIYRYGDRIYGFQCHFELTKELVLGMIDACPDDLKPGKYIMNVDDLLKVNYDEINTKMDLVLDYLVSLPEIDNSLSIERDNNKQGVRMNNC